MIKLQQNGTLWRDTDGNELHAHGGHILSYGGFYYWYGEDRRDDIYVSVYRSVDLVNWEFRAHCLTVSSKFEKAPSPTSSRVQPTACSRQRTSSSDNGGPGKEQRPWARRSMGGRPVCK